jgi:hypothetical protein
MNEKIDVLNYDKLNEDHKQAAREIYEMAKQTDNVMLAEMIKHKFELESREYFDIDTIEVIKKCKKNNINVHVQGFIKENEVFYPIVSIIADARELNKLS